MTHLARIVAALGAALAAWPAAAAAPKGAQAQARAVIVEPMAVRMQWAMAMPSVRGGVEGASFAGRMPSMAMGMMMPANARLMIRREDETGEPVTAPGAFEIVAKGRGEAMILRTGLSAGVRFADDGVFAGGALRGHAAASIDVGRAGLVLESTGTPPATGTLIVLVQYN